MKLGEEAMQAPSEQKRISSQSPDLFGMLCFVIIIIVCVVYIGFFAVMAFSDRADVELATADEVRGASECARASMRISLDSHQNFAISKELLVAIEAECVRTQDIRRQRSIQLEALQN